ncbi:GLE1 RNA export mediator-like (yeast), isoform CRA_b [Rattus norvegicus]|uniref:GLE1 RNA export mediator-like (Yeast), isoform CRA_b n=1 Tax=Rattus norvegicus TaxID=10116 RepID=A6JTT9_RAT|nr:GLE1 RNA export mediator-like (yeast), isoform CRA_b [Rattus norvegicus]
MRYLSVGFHWRLKVIGSECPALPFRRSWLSQTEAGVCSMNTLTLGCRSQASARVMQASCGRRSH